MERSFLQRYLQSFQTIEGWFSFDAALLFMAYSNLAREHPAAGDVLEIGVHHGLSSIAVAALRGPGKRFVAIDLFEKLQDRNISRSGAGKRTVFEANMRAFNPDLNFLEIITGVSGQLTPAKLGSGFTFCHIDGGHSRAETYADLCLCHEISAPGGLIAIDDYFNPDFPGVAEGAVEFMLGHQGALTPVAIGYSKVLFQKAPATSLDSAFSQAYPDIPQKRVIMWGCETPVFSVPLREYFDLFASAPDALVRFGAAGRRAVIEPHATSLEVRAGSHAALPVTVTNTSGETFPAGTNVFGLSYHLLSEDGRELVHDNERVWIEAPLAPNGQVKLELPVNAPAERGRCQIEIDLVWEGVMWFKDVANPTASITLFVI